MTRGPTTRSPIQTLRHRLGRWPPGGRGMSGRLAASTAVAPDKPAVERRHPPNALMRLINPLTRRLVGRGRAGDQILLLHYVGRRSGRHFDVPAGYHLIGGVVSVFTNSGWRHNFAGGRNIEVTLRGVRQPAQAVLCDDPDEVAESYERLIEDLGTDRAARRLGLRFNVDRAPTRDELKDGIRRSGLSLVRIYSVPPARAEGDF
jgi:hypothetical protein